MKITKVTKNGKWWKGTRTTWAMKDRDGDWWLMKNKTSKNNTKKCKNCSCKTSYLTWKEYILIALSLLLGVSLAYNLYNLL